MDATYNFSLGFSQAREPKTGTPNRLLFNRQTLQLISTGVSLVSLSLGFSLFGIVIIMNQHQADLNDLSGNASYATAGGIGAILVGAGFFLAACLHWRSCRHPIRKSARQKNPNVLKSVIDYASSGGELLATPADWPS
jgi:hypothetical protein